MPFTTKGKADEIYLDPRDTGRSPGFDRLSSNGAIVPGSANDPTSPAYFQQAVGDRVLFEVDQASAPCKRGSRVFAVQGRTRGPDARCKLRERKTD